VPARVVLHWRTWPDEAEEVVFNAASGQIHLLDALSAAALRAIAARAASIAEIARELARVAELDEAAVADRLAEICGRLDQIGLIEPAPP